MTAYLLPAAMGLVAFALMLGAMSARCALGFHAWRVRGPAVQCARCSRRVPLYPMNWSKR